MERVPKPFLMLTIFLIAFLTTSTTIEGGRDIPSDNEVSNPQSFSASSPSFDPSSFPRYPWFGGFKGADQASSKDKTDDSQGPYGDDRSLSNQQWAIHGSKEAGIDKNQGLYDARFPIFHHWGFPWLPWFGGIKAEATMKDMATGGHGYGDPAKAADGSKVAAGETP